MAAFQEHCWADLDFALRSICVSLVIWTQTLTLIRILVLIIIILLHSITSIGSFYLLCHFTLLMKYADFPSAGLIKVDKYNKDNKLPYHTMHNLTLLYSPL